MKRIQPRKDEEGGEPGHKPSKDNEEDDAEEEEEETGDPKQKFEEGELFFLSSCLRNILEEIHCYWSSWNSIGPFRAVFLVLFKRV